MGTGEVSLKLRVLATLADDTSLILMTYMAAHHHLYLLFQRIWSPLLASVGTRYPCAAQTYMQTTYPYTLNKLKQMEWETSLSSLYCWALAALWSSLIKRMALSEVPSRFCKSWRVSIWKNQVGIKKGQILLQKHTTESLKLTYSSS